MGAVNLCHAAARSDGAVEEAITRRYLRIAKANAHASAHLSTCRAKFTGPKYK